MRAAIQLALIVLYVALWGIAGSTALFLVGWLLAISLGPGAGGSLSPFGTLAGLGPGVWLAVTALRWHRFHWACLVLGLLGAVGWYGMGRWLRPELGGALVCLILIFSSAAIALAGLTGSVACWVENVTREIAWRLCRQLAIVGLVAGTALAIVYPIRIELFWIFKNWWYGLSDRWAMHQ